MMRLSVRSSLDIVISSPLPLLPVSVSPSYEAEDAAAGADMDAAEREQRVEAERRLPAHLLAAGRERRALSVAPEDTLTKIPLSADAILLYLHQNFIELFAIKTAGVGAATFERQFEALESILDGLCAADRISTASFHYEQAASNGVEPGRLKELCALVAMRSVLFNFYLDESNKPPSTTATKNVWMPLHKPFVYKMNETRQKRSRVATLSSLRATLSLAQQALCGHRVQQALRVRGALRPTQGGQYQDEQLGCLCCCGRRSPRRRRRRRRRQCQCVQRSAAHRRDDEGHHNQRQQQQQQQQLRVRGKIRHN